MADIGAISAQQIIAGQTQKSKSNTKTTLDMNDFLSLIVKQLQNQDMTNPMDDAAMMNQMVQMATINAMSTLTEASVTSYSASLVGKEVTIGERVGGAVNEIAGIVTGTAVYGGQQVIFVNDKSYYLTDIMAVGKLPAKEETVPEEKPAEETVTEGAVKEEEVKEGAVKEEEVKEEAVKEEVTGTETKVETE